MPAGRDVDGPNRRPLPPSDLDVGGRVPHRGVDALHHGLQLFHGTHFEELCHAVFDHEVDGRLPLHRRTQLLAQEWNDLARGCARLNLLASEVHVDIADGRLHLRQQLIQSLLQLLLGWLHQASMESPRGLQQLCLHGSGFLCGVLELVDGRRSAGAREALWEEQVCDLADLVAGGLLLTQLLQDGLLETGDGEHGLRGGLCGFSHRLAAHLHQLHALFEREDFSCAKCCVLSQ
mmetsp:Transcript_58849/g.136999  ORF Transcript_58849/g.136999 Transcript_58849/m.136999 type:complete len:234 (-) Transcript_58849:887-1588(-)